MMGDLVPKERLLEKQITSDAEKEVKRIYQLTAGFTDPEPPTNEQVKMMAMGLIEL
jgi:hypothetical protein